MRNCRTQSQRLSTSFSSIVLSRSTSTNSTSSQRTKSSLSHSISQQDYKSTNKFNGSRSRSTTGTKSKTKFRSYTPNKLSSIDKQATTIELAKLEPILNTDTDSLKIGDRVYVNGEWPGVIVYIGETLFAEGEWCAVVLDDETNGCNDGRVGGKRYFQTNPNRGIFCRLTKVTRTPVCYTKTLFDT
ncbi:unnamed protein product [Didymodactylos carnosus]|uniref:CAP-Gly domain-containing protein n=1 Tax=Didymodactylos carnosus TaxID=1234261 RepID=A0A8S2HHN8_9BILA|nr:unnamed protein product [Didymodactylos carnosus]CAF3643100.1 unnamed protein product [Didymodactylos carnosus]